MQSHLAGTAEITAHLVRLQQRHVEDLIVRILDDQHFAGDATAGQCAKSPEDPDAVIDVHRVIPLVEVGERELRHRNRRRIRADRCRHLPFRRPSLAGESGCDQLLLRDEQQLFGRERKSGADSGDIERGVADGQFVPGTPRFERGKIFPDGGREPPRACRNRRPGGGCRATSAAAVPPRPPSHFRRFHRRSLRPREIRRQPPLPGGTPRKRRRRRPSPPVRPPSPPTKSPTGGTPPERHTSPAGRGSSPDRPSAAASLRCAK